MTPAEEIALKQEAQEARAEVAQGRQEAALLQQRAHISGQVIPWLAALPNDIAVAIVKATVKKALRQLADPRGLGKPPHFKGDEPVFAVWIRKTEMHIMSVHLESGELLRRAAEDPNAIDLNVLKEDPKTPEDSVVDEVNAQMYCALMALAPHKHRRRLS